MEIEGTRQAFEKMLEVRGVYKYLGVEPPTVSNWKRYLTEGKAVSLDKMEEMLEKFGARVKQEKVWRMPYLGDDLVALSEMRKKLKHEWIRHIKAEYYPDLNVWFEENFKTFVSSYKSPVDGQTFTYTCLTDVALLYLENGNLSELITDAGYELVKEKE